MRNSRTTRGRVARRVRPGRSLALVLTGVIAASALWVVVAAVASADPPPVNCVTDPGDGQCKKLVPVLTCVWPNGNGTFAAVFGYANSSSHSISVAVSSQNQFVPSPTYRGQPTWFPAGARVSNAFVVTMSGSLTWQLTGHSVTATASSTKCSQNPVPLVGDWRAFVIALVFCAPIGYVAYRRLRPRWTGFRWQLAPAAQPRSK